MRSMGVRWMRMEKEFLLCHRDASALILRIVGAWGRWLVEGDPLNLVGA